MFNNGAQMTMPVVPAYASNGGNSGNSGFGDGYSWIWILLIFAIFGFGNNGFGYGGGNGTNGAGFQGWATRADVNEGFMANNLQSGINAIQQGICDATYAINNNITNGFHGVTIGQNAIQSQLASCCCDLQTAIQGVNYNMATQSCDIKTQIANSTRDIIDNNNCNTRSVLDFLTNSKISDLQAENQALKLSASQQMQNAFFAANQEAQTAEIIRRLTPTTTTT